MPTSAPPRSRALDLERCDAVVTRPAAVAYAGRHPVTRGVMSLALHVLDVGHRQGDHDLERAGGLLEEAALAYYRRHGVTGDELLERAVELVPELGQVCVVHGMVGCTALCPEGCRDDC